MYEVIDFSNLEKALKIFSSATANPPKSELERDGIIQRFEYTFELCWKSIRKLLQHMGRIDVSASPKPLFRDALEEKIIKDIDVWFAYLDARNRTSHGYNSYEAKKVYDAIKGFADDVEELLKELNARL